VGRQIITKIDAAILAGGCALMAFYLISMFNCILTFATIMPTFDGVSVTIRVDGVDLEEFSVERDVEERRVECWVPSQVDKVFVSSLLTSLC
jgi:hypothetical protein